MSPAAPPEPTLSPLAAMAEETRVVAEAHKAYLAVLDVCKAARIEPWGAMVDRQLRLVIIDYFLAAARAQTIGKAKARAWNCGIPADGVAS